jgi:hypothetical protein
MTALFCKKNFISQINLLENSSADEPLNNGWKIVKGNWTLKNNDPLPKYGDNYFYAGENCCAELCQTVSIQQHNYNQYYLFGMWVRNKEDYDKSYAIADFMNNNKKKASFKLDKVNAAIEWQYIDIFIQKPKNNANKLNIRLISERNKGESNDGYIDEVMLFKVNVRQPQYYLFSKLSLVDFNIKFKSTNGEWIFRENDLMQCNNDNTNLELITQNYGPCLVLQTLVKTTSNGKVGIVFCKMHNNYYSVYLNFQNNTLVLNVVNNGIETEIANAHIDLLSNFWYSLRVEKYENNINVFINNIKNINVDDDTYECGRVGLTTIECRNSKFKYLFAGQLN